MFHVCGQLEAQTARAVDRMFRLSDVSDTTVSPCHVRYVMLVCRPQLRWACYLNGRLHEIIDREKRKWTRREIIDGAFGVL